METFRETLDQPDWIFIRVDANQVGSILDGLQRFWRWDERNDVRTEVYHLPENHIVFAGKR